MKLTGHLKKWGSGVLGVVSLILLVNLVMQFSGVRAGAPRPAGPLAIAPASAQEKKGTHGGKDELAGYDPTVRLDLLKELAQRPLPELGRNPFEFAGQPAAPKPAAPPAPAPQAPPPPPPMPLKAMGYSEEAGGMRAAYITFEDQVIVAHEGDVVGQKYKVLKITTTVVTVEDSTNHQATELQIPQ